ncbi:hypothetical protein ACFQ1T_12010 [Methylophilus glucosoxydans]|uniref:Uncharacterized protein n=1 Tax=Methylophilus glucosoxydans TaxID=752553 RepID=A0ABW3GMZ9_9PROT
MQKLIDYILSLNLSDVGSWASLLGLAVTFFTATAVVKIKKRFLFRSSIDTHAENILNISSEVTILLRQYTENKQQIEEQFALVDVELRSMQKGSNDDLLSDIKNARKLIKKYRSRIWFFSKKNEASAREIKTSLSVVSAELVHHRKSLMVGN